MPRLRGTWAPASAELLLPGLSRFVLRATSLALRPRCRRALRRLKSGEKELGRRGGPRECTLRRVARISGALSLRRCLSPRASPHSSKWPGSRSAIASSRDFLTSMTESYHHGNLAEWSKAVDSSSTIFGCVGSDPTVVMCGPWREQGRVEVTAASAKNFGSRAPWRLRPR